jgi:hypothetical protein
MCFSDVHPTFGSHAYEQVESVAADSAACTDIRPNPMVPMVFRSLRHLLATALIASALSTFAASGLAAQQSAVRECGVARDSAVSDAQHAIACAEEFVRRNGYTEAPPTADSLLAFESIESVNSLRELLERRHDTLGERAFAVCIGKADGDGLTGHSYAVVFLVRITSLPHARVVTMSAQFDQLRVQHRGFVFSHVEDRHFGCRSVTEALTAPG